MVCLQILVREVPEDSKTLAIAISLIPHGSHVKDLYNKNCKTAEKEIKDDTRRWKDCPLSIIYRRLWKLLYYQKLSYRWNTISLKISMAFFIEQKNNKSKQNILIFFWKHKIQIGEGILSRKRYHNTWSPSILQSCSNQTVWSCYKIRHIDNRTE